jgi:hypothetical protein
LETDRELLADLTVFVFDDVLGVAVDAYQSENLDFDPGLLPDLSYCSLGDTLTQLDDSTRKRPTIVVRPVDEKDATLRVSDYRGHRWDH